MMRFSPSNVLLTAKVEMSTIRTMAMRSSMMRMPNTYLVYDWLRSPISSNALMMMAVDDMDIIPPNRILVVMPHPNDMPTRNPRSIMNDMMVTAAMAAVCPTFNNFLKLKSNPKLNSRKMTPISDHEPMSDVSDTVGVSAIWELTRHPATIYPNTTGCFNHLNKMVIIPPAISINAKSASNEGMFSILLKSFYRKFNQKFTFMCRYNPNFIK